MKKLLTTMMFMSIFSVLADDLDNLKYYQTSNTQPGETNPNFAVFIKNNEACIFLKDFRDNSIKEFCQMGESPFNLKTDFPSVYPASMQMTRASLYFIVAAPWNEQECEIYFPDKSITCESTGR